MYVFNKKSSENILYMQKGKMGVSWHEGSKGKNVNETLPGKPSWA
jgi:hypothetical protein